MGFCKFTKSERPASVSGYRKSLSLRGAKRRGNPFFSCKETDSHASDAVTGVGMTGSGTSRTPSPTGCSSHTGTSGRRPLQRLIAPIRRGTMPTHRPAGQMRILRRDTWVPPYRVRRSCRTGRRGRRPLQRLTVPIRRGVMPTHRPAGSTKRQAQAPASLSKKSGWTFSASWQAKSQNKNYILFCDFGRCGG